jgi:hypothetical protein
MSPGVSFAAATVSTGSVVWVVIVKSLAMAEEIASAPRARNGNTHFFILLPFYAIAGI